jgi:hypothetical protein
MTIKHPFRQMRYDLRFVRAMAGLLLALPGQEWPQMDYVLFFSVSQLTDKMDSPTRNKMLGCIIWWLRFCKRLIDALPEGDAKVNSVKEWDKVSTEYKYLLEDKAA